MTSASKDITLKDQIFQVTEDNFESLALEIFHYQYQENKVYREYCDAIRVNINEVNNLERIPFLPIQFFKNRTITSGSVNTKFVFESSGTTDATRSRHYIHDISLYEESFTKGFQFFFGELSGLCILALLPSYLERKNSSLVYMVNELIQTSGHPDSGFYLHNYDDLHEAILRCERSKQRLLLIGVSYALLDFMEKYPIKLQHTVMMETGGMKGRREELSREQLHILLKQQSGLNEIYSEYGMTELLSQAYSLRNGIFKSPPWMKILLRAEDDPLHVTGERSLSNQPATGAVNIIDLANLYSCCFIASDDRAKLYKDGSFEILGRMEKSEQRGCGLMIL